MKKQKSTGVNIVIRQHLFNNILFQNARITDGMCDQFGDVWIENGIIRKVARKIDFKASDIAEIIDLQGLSLLPAMADVHCHFREPGYEYKEDIDSGLRAAIKGGYGFVAAMANTLPVADTYDIISANNAKAKSANLCDFLQIAAIGKGLCDSELVDVETLLKLTRLFSNDGNSILCEDFMLRALQASAQYGFVLATHCQPEEELIERDLHLLKKVPNAQLHICHVSKVDSVEMIRNAKREKLPVTCEVTPHHLFAAQADIAMPCDLPFVQNLDYKVNPPIGNFKDRLALIEGLRDGTIDMLASDHAPHSEEDKRAGAPGIANIETAFGMYLQVFDEDGSLSLKDFCRLTSDAPYQLLGRQPARIKEGKEATLIVADVETKGKIDTSDFVSKSKNTPFDGWDIRGKVLRTYIRGEKKYDSGQTL